MRRRILLMALVGVAGGLLPTLPTLTASATTSLPSSATITVADDQFEAPGGGSAVNIALGGSVTFTYPVGGTTQHNIDFGSGPQPSFCTIGSGSTTQVSPPVPSVPTSAGWTATCTFNTAGTYTFHCDKHTFMTGTVYVGAQTTTTTATDSTTASTGSTPGSTTTMTMPMSMPMPTTTTGTSTTSAQPALIGGVHSGVGLGSSRGGALIHGTLKIAAAGQGGQAVISVLAPNSTLGAGRHGKHLVDLGRLRIDNLHSGPVAFRVALKPAAKRALAARKHLTVTVKIVVSAAGAQTITITHRLVLRS